MAVTITAQYRIGPTTWRIEVASTLGDPTFYWYVDGILIDSSNQPFRTFEIGAGEQGQIEILDDPDATPSAVYPGRVLLTWHPDPANADIENWRVDEYVDGDWTERITTPATQWGQEWTSRYLEDNSTHRFRVVPLGANSIEGVAREFSVLMVRLPDLPDVTYSYDDGTGAVTATAA